MRSVKKTESIPLFIANSERVMVIMVNTKYKW